MKKYSNQTDEYKKSEKFPELIKREYQQSTVKKIGEQTAV